MTIRGRLLPGLFLLGTCLLTAPASPPDTRAPGAPDPDQLSSFYRPEVRLRKLHLVRPDLIPYPIEYEVYC